MADVFVKGKRIRLDPSRSIGKGGEADIFDIGGGKALKVYKKPTHPDYQGLPTEQAAASDRIQERQIKLPAFPRNLPRRVIAPEELATNQSGQHIEGFTAHYVTGVEVLLKYAEKGFRQGGVDPNVVPQIFRDMHTTLTGIHKAGVVIGDFNDLNILVRGGEAYFIDADSFQFGSFLCRVFTAKFVDPLLCDPKHTNGLMLAKPHTTNSDWYAFAVMLMQCLLYVGPYGGIFRPKNQAQRLLHDARPLQRITVFHPEVVYPKPAMPLKRLPDELLEYFQQTFVHDKRGEMPPLLLEQLRWTTCAKCGAEHARRVCPECTHGVPTVVMTVRGNVTMNRIFQTKGVILFAAMQGGHLCWLYHESSRFKREQGNTVLDGDLDPQMRFRIQGEATLIGKDARLVTISSGKAPSQLGVDQFGSLPMFDANSRSRYWVENGRLLRDGDLGSEFIGDVLSGQTLFWVGDQFGFGFYRAGDLSVAFVFDAQSRGLNDSIALPRLRGQLVDSTCVFTKDRCWFFVATRESGQTITRCLVIRSNGVIEATHQAVEGDGSWLGTLRGKCAAGNFLLSPTDEGVVRVEVNGGQIVETKRFPDTEPFVDTHCQLFLGKEGLYVVSRNEICLLQMS